MPEKRRFRSRTRRSGFRDAKLIIIAAEGSHTEREYFLDLASREYHRNPRVHVEVLEGEQTASSPEHVLRRLRKFKRTYHLNNHDELWLVIDRDRWPEAGLARVCTESLHANFQVAVSNPCFELWLLLHLKPLDGYSAEIQREFRDNVRSGGRTRLETELVSILGAYRKTEPDTARFLPHVRLAIQRARDLDVHPDHRWPNDLGSRVYLLVESILES